MKKVFLGLIVYALSFCAYPAVSAVPLGDADVDVFDLQSVRRGASLFVNHCSGCHSIKHIRYSRLAADLKLKEEDLRQDVMLDGVKFQDSFAGGMDADDSREWFGVAPPDLSLIARARGVDWLYSYLKGFYLDPARPTGVNNVVFQDVAMPNALWDLQGLQKAVHKRQDGAEVIERLQLVEPGKMTPGEFDQAVNDLVTFLDYASEPSQYQRLRLGKYVLFGMTILMVVFYRLKKAYWKDIT
jgi:ubiquinol-cytochrome c reductase cytochrome c1 subunit